MKWDYYPITGHGGSIERRITIDGELPFAEANSLSFCRLWKNADEEIKVDTQGNQIMINQVEAPAWTTQYAVDSSGTVDGPFRFYFTAGSHTLTVDCLMEPMLLKQITLCPVSDNKVIPYSEIINTYKNINNASTNATVVLQGEEANVKSNQTLSPLSDKTSPSVEPYNYAKIVYNTIGGSRWINAGQWLEWKFYAGEDALYSLSAHFKQSLKENLSSSRTIYIDGQLPFEEAKDWQFPYSSSWQTQFFSDGNGTPYSFYLNKGWHTIRLEVSLGDYRGIIAESRQLLSKLNEIYRSIVMVSGPDPDLYRDYKFDKTIPETIKQIEEIYSHLISLEKVVQKIEGNSNNVADIKRVYDQLKLMLDDTDTIAARLTTFKDNIAAFGTWINNQQGQPLELDWISFSSSEQELPPGELNVFKVISHYIKTFLVSFFTDYEMIGQTQVAEGDSIKIWMSTSRDQANVLRQLITNDFTPNHGVPASVQLVTQTALLPAILANKGPDIALGIAQSEVNNLALRNAAYNLLEFEDCEQLSQEFYDYSLNAFRWNQGLYAMPETQTWPMLFYRKDIMKQLGIPVSDLNTWDSILHSVLPKLQKNSLSFGLLPTIYNYLNFLYQEGGELYLNDGKNSGLATGEAIQSMKVFSMLYKQYGLDLAFDFSNRFRTGEMPIAVVDFTSYNTLTLFAGEIKGLWGMLPVPGTVKSDGTVDHTATAVLAGTVMFSSSSNKDEAWEFMKWWSSSETQNHFGTMLESVVGTAARYNTANKNAIKLVQWDSDMRSAMIYQADSCKEYPEVPGGYFTSRLFDFAFRSIIYDDEDIRGAMDDVAVDIDREMSNKRSEYGLN